MQKYRIKISYPERHSGRRVENMAEVKMKVTKEVDWIYYAIAKFEDEIFKGLRDNLSKVEVTKNIELKSIVNIHDHDGLRNVKQIKRMRRSIREGRHALHRSGMPNVKIFKAGNGRLYLFDGHHTMLAYMSAGKKFLHKVPYIMIERKDEKRICDDSFCHFFGGLLRYRRREKWPFYTVNWQARGAKKLCARKEKNMGELFEALYNPSHYA